MKTEEKEAALAPTFKIAGFIVMQGDKPCTVENVSGLHRGGVLVPGLPAILYLKRRDVQRAAARTKRVAAVLKGSMIEAWAAEKAPTLFNGAGGFTIIPIGRQS